MPLAIATALAVLLAAPPQAVPSQTPVRTGIAGPIRDMYRSIRRNILGAAQLMPESEYGFRPTPEVRTFGAIVGHLANTQYNFCVAASGGARPEGLRNFEELTAKAELVRALEDALIYCDAVYDAVTDATAADSVKWGPGDISRAYALIYNVAHDNEHYGNFVTYLRMKGIVPPSSQRSGG